MTTTNKTTTANRRGRKALRDMDSAHRTYGRAVRARKAARFTVETKRAAVAALLSGKAERNALALKLGTYPGVLSRWAMDKRFGGVAGGLSGRGVGAFVPHPAKPRGRRKAGAR